jgi:hypothetical protein
MAGRRKAPSGNNQKGKKQAILAKVKLVLVHSNHSIRQMRKGGRFFERVLSGWDVDC